MSVAVASIRCAGQPIDPAIEVLHLSVRRDLNRVPEARLVLLDGEVAQGSFEVSDAPQFKLGAEVSIALRWEGGGSDQVVFEGLVVRQTVRAGADGSRLQIDLKDRSVVLTRERHSQVFRDMNDADAIAKLLSAAGLKKATIAHTAHKHPALVQYHATDWDFIVSRADVQGLVVDAHRGAVKVASMVPTGAPRRMLRWGHDDILDFNLEIDGSSQWAKIAAEGWDVAQQKVIGPQNAADPGVHIGDVNAAEAAKALGGAVYRLLHPVPSQSAELQAWADARLKRSRLALLRGSLTIPGDAALVPLDLVELQRIGKHFNGQALVSGITHVVEGGTWTTELRLGLDPAWFARQPDIAEAPAAGLLPALQGGLQIGVVAGIADDPDSEVRIKVQLPALGSGDGTLWARHARPDAGKDRGMAFLPEVGDEVVLGFLDGDPRHPVVLGALHGSKNTPPAFVASPSESNPKRALVSRSGCLLGFDDEKKQIVLQTPGGQRLLLDDDGKRAVLTDQHGNTVTLDQDGIVLKSVKNFSIDAPSGQVVIKGSTVDIQ